MDPADRDLYNFPRSRSQILRTRCFGEVYFQYAVLLGIGSLHRNCGQRIVPCPRSSWSVNRTQASQHDWQTSGHRQQWEFRCSAVETDVVSGICFCKVAFHRILGRTCSPTRHLRGAERTCMASTFSHLSQPSLSLQSQPSLVQSRVRPPHDDQTWRRSGCGRWVWNVV